MKKSICSICGMEIKSSDHFVGTGTGDGNSFAHYGCYYKYEQDQSKSLKPNNDFTVDNGDNIVITKIRYNELVRKEQNFDKVMKKAFELCKQLMNTINPSYLY